MPTPNEDRAAIGAAVDGITARAKQAVLRSAAGVWARRALITLIGILAAITLWLQSVSEQVADVQQRIEGAVETPGPPPDTGPDESPDVVP